MPYAREKKYAGLIWPLFDLQYVILFENSKRSVQSNYKLSKTKLVSYIFFFSGKFHINSFTGTFQLLFTSSN